MPLVKGNFRNMVHDQAALLGFLAFPTQVKAWPGMAGHLDEDVAVSTMGNSPL